MTKSPPVPLATTSVLNTCVGSCSSESSYVSTPLPSQQTHPFDKDELTRMIESGGGKILQDFDYHWTADLVARCFLISASYHRTRMYFCALAAGVPCVSHVWIHVCIKQGRLLDHASGYWLPAGFSIESNEMIERSILTVRKGLLRELTVCLTAGSNSGFVGAWREVLLEAGCHLVSRLSTRVSQANDRNTVDVVVTDRSVGATLLQQAKRLGVPVVSIEWVLQSLICGRRFDFLAHPKYRHNAD